MSLLAWNRRLALILVLILALPLSQPSSLSARPAHATAGPAPAALHSMTHDRLAIGLQTAIPQLSPATPNPQSILPGSTATFRHTLTNSGDTSGQFTVSLQHSAPAGWTFLYSPSGPFTLAPAATQEIEVTISAQAGASAPDAGSSATAHLQVLSADGGVATASDTAVALLQPAFQFSLATQPTITNAVPGRTAVFTHTLTNDGNGTDTFTITVSPPGGWSADPIAPITLARNASQPVVVRVHAPNGQGVGSYPFDVTAQSTSTPLPTPQTRIDTVVVVGAAVPQLSPMQLKSASSSLPATVSFTHILTNTGNQAGTFSLAAVVQGAPPGWSAAPSQPSCSLVQNASCTFTVNVTVPAGAQAGDQEITVTASITGPPAVSSRVVDVVRVPAIPSLQFTPTNLSGAGDPAGQVSYLHTLTNTGNADDTYTVTLDLTPGWSATVDPVTVAVPRGQSRPVTVTVTLPSGVPAGSTGVVTATATASHAPHPSAQIVDQTTMNAQVGAELQPATQTGFANPGPTLADTAIFTYTLRNSGSVALTYALAHTDLLGWTTLITPSVVGPLQPGATAVITLGVTAPAGTPVGSPPNLTTLIARDPADPPEAPPLATATARTIPGGVLLEPQLNTGSAEPGATQIYTHTLTNTSPDADTFLLSVSGDPAWNPAIQPLSIALDPGASTTISVTLQVPTAAISGTLNTTSVEITSSRYGIVLGTAEEQTRVISAQPVEEHQVFLPLVIYASSDLEQHQVYLPLVVGAGFPDLVVERIDTGDGSIQVVVRNQGSAAVTTPFWVDLYIAPVTPPTAVNQTWQTQGGQGVTWGVAGAALPILPGGTLTLSLGDAFYRPELSSIPAVLPPGTPLYAHVDSANTQSAYSGVLEDHEARGGAYNNILGPIRSAVGAGILDSAAATGARDERLPGGRGARI